MPLVFPFHRCRSSEQVPLRHACGRMFTIFIIETLVFVNHNESMAKKAYIGIRTTEETRAILEKLAKEGYRTLSQQCEMILIEWLKGHNSVKDEKKRSKN
jgi:hypothetical protein